MWHDLDLDDTWSDIKPFDLDGDIELIKFFAECLCFADDVGFVDIAVQLSSVEEISAKAGDVSREVWMSKVRFGLVVLGCFLL